MPHDTELTDLLNYDALNEVDKLRGDHRLSQAVDLDMLALALHISKSHQVNEALEHRDDTKLSNKLDRYTRIIEELGFVKVLDTPFIGRGWGDDETVEEHQMVYAHPDGMLLVFDTFNGDGVNGASVYYAHQQLTNNPQHVYSSGGWETISGTWPENRNDRNPADMYWFGDHDAREALRHKIQGLREAGQFLNPWPASKRGKRWLWMCHYMDLDDLRYGDPGYQQGIDDARKRLDLLPDWVKTMINIDTLSA